MLRAKSDTQQRLHDAVLALASAEQVVVDRRDSERQESWLPRLRDSGDLISLGGYLPGPTPGEADGVDYISGMRERERERGYM